MLIAVLAHAGVNLTGRDVYVNVAGGLRIEEPAADLAVAVALASSLREQRQYAAAPCSPASSPWRDGYAWPVRPSAAWPRARRLSSIASSLAPRVSRTGLRQAARKRPWTAIRAPFRARRRAGRPVERPTKIRGVARCRHRC